MNQKNLYHIPIEDLIYICATNFPDSKYEYKKHLVEINKSSETLATLRLPLHYALNENMSLVEEEQVILYLTIEAGNAAICVQEGLQNTFHTTFSSYMTRKKQGFSQVKYLNKKGKSRAGSRVRLASTIEFFEDINTVLQELFEDLYFDRIAISCTPTLMPYLYGSKIECPFEKTDDRLYKIPLHIPQSNFSNLSSAINKLKAPVLFYEDDSEGFGELFNNY